MEIILILAVAIFLIIYSDFRNQETIEQLREENGKLLDRLMSKDLHEYKVMAADVPAENMEPVEPTHKDISELSEFPDKKQ